MLGGDGVISVTANVAPKAVAQVKRVKVWRETKRLGWSVKDRGREAPLLIDSPHKTSFLLFFFAALFSC